MKVIITILALFISSSLTADELEDILTKVLKESHLPSLAAAVTKDGKVLAQAVVGVRKAGSPDLVTVNDKYHIGSCTKSMTATLAAMLVEEGKLKWTSKIVDVFPELKEAVHKSYHQTTLEQLLSMTGGVPNVFEKNKKLWNAIYSNKKTMTPVEQREFLFREVLKREALDKPEAVFKYSNSSVTIAGMMLEKVSGKTWEELIQDKLAKPLKITSLGFGAPATDKAKIDQPYGHVKNGVKNTPVLPGFFDDNPAAIAPAGLVHLSIGDFAKYTAFYASKCSPLLRGKSFKKLTTPLSGEYALGWLALQRQWGGKVLHHSGSNTINYAIMWISPSKNFSLVVAANTAGPGVEAALDKVAGEIINNYLK